MLFWLLDIDLFNGLRRLVFVTERFTSGFGSLLRWFRGLLVVIRSLVSDYGSNGIDFLVAWSVIDRSFEICALIRNKRIFFEIIAYIFLQILL